MYTYLFQIYICIVLACAVLAIAEPEPQLGAIRAAPGYTGGRGFGGYGGGHQRGFGGYGAGLGGRGGFGGYGGGRFARSPAGFDNSGFGGSSYAGQGFQQQRGLPYEAGTFADPRFDGFQG